jgi:hypothetical protein
MLERKTLIPKKQTTTKKSGNQLANQNIGLGIPLS